MKQPYQQGFPNVSAPIADNGGYVQQAWLQLFINLWNRTGSSGGSSIFSTGDLKESAVAGDQPGWLECDGLAISRSQYQTLFEAIGVTYGAGDGTTTFNKPDYRGRVRPGTSISFPLGTLGGSATQTLSTANLAAHSHDLNDFGHTHVFTADPHDHTITDPGHQHPSVIIANTNTAGSAAGSVTPGNTGTAATGISIDDATITGTNALATTGITLQDTGTGTPFSILPPYAPVTILIKT